MSFALCCVVLTSYLDNKFRFLAILCNNTKIWNDSKSMTFLSYSGQIFLINVFCECMNAPVLMLFNRTIMSCMRVIGADFH